MVDTDADPDARSVARTLWGWSAVVGDPDRTPAGREVSTVLELGDAQRLAELGRTVAQVAIAPRRRATGPTHLLDAGHRRQPSEEHGHPLAVFAAHRVAAPMHSVC